MKNSIAKIYHPRVAPNSATYKTTPAAKLSKKKPRTSNELMIECEANEIAKYSKIPIGNTATDLV